jgi:tight adherence protein C
MLLTVAVVSVGFAIALAVFAVLTHSEERAVVRDSLRQLDDYEVESLRETELLSPLRERAIAPVLQGLTDIGRRLTPGDYSDRVRQKLVASGQADSDALDRFLAVRVVTIAFVPVALFLTYRFLPASGMAMLAALGLVGFVLIAGPDAQLNRKVEERATELRRKLPDVMDLLVISVEAGLGFEQALDRTVAAVPGALSEEFSRMLGEIRAGANRADAMRSLDARTNLPEIRAFVLAILQADTFGVSIGGVLRSQAEEMRVRRRQLAQERAQKAPVKMMIPMVFCIFPALFVVVLGPAAVNMMEAF